MYSLSNELILGVFPVVLYMTIGNRRITSILSLHVFKEISTACKDLPKTLNKPSEPRSAAADQTTRHLGVAPSTTGREPLLLIVPEGRSPESRIISNGICHLRCPGPSSEPRESKSARLARRREEEGSSRNPRRRRRWWATAGDGSRI